MSVSSFANIETPVSSKEVVKKEIRTKIVKLLGNADFHFDKELTTSVDLFINRKGQIVVLDVKSNNESVVNYVTRKLNYKKVVGKLSKGMKIYKMPLRIVK